MKNKKKHKNRNSKRERNGYRIIPFPQTEDEGPAFANEILDEVRRAGKRKDRQMRIKFAFPGRSQIEAQVIGAWFTNELAGLLENVSAGNEISVSDRENLGSKLLGFK